MGGKVKKFLCIVVAVHRFEPRSSIIFSLYMDHLTNGGIWGLNSRGLISRSSWSAPLWALAIDDLADFTLAYVR